MATDCNSALGKAAFSGALYFAGMFVLGFVLSTIRVLWVAPSLGELNATLVELPFMLALSWIYCRWLLRRRRVHTNVPTRCLMGLVALVLFLCAEILLGPLLLGQSAMEQLRKVGSGPGLAGLLGQLCFAAFPLIQLRRRLGT